MYKIVDKLKCVSKISGVFNFTIGNIYIIAVEIEQDGKYVIFDDNDKAVYFDLEEIIACFHLMEYVEIESTKNNDFASKVKKVLNNIETILIQKNRKYGNSALEPVRIFSKLPKDEQLKVRIDDKLSRISNQQLDEDEDVITDLIGYLVLLEIAKEKE